MACTWRRYIDCIYWMRWKVSSNRDTISNVYNPTLSHRNLTQSSPLNKYKSHACYTTQSQKSPLPPSKSTEIRLGPQRSPACPKPTSPTNYFLYQHTKNRTLLATSLYLSLHPSHPLSRVLNLPPFASCFYSNTSQYKFNHKPLKFPNPHIHNPLASHFSLSVPHVSPIA